MTLAVHHPVWTPLTAETGAALETRFLPPGGNEPEGFINPHCRRCRQWDGNQVAAQVDECAGYGGPAALPGRTGAAAGVSRDSRRASEGPHGRGFLLPGPYPRTRHGFPRPWPSIMRNPPSLRDGGGDTAGANRIFHSPAGAPGQPPPFRWPGLVNDRTRPRGPSPRERPSARARRGGADVPALPADAVTT